MRTRSEGIRIRYLYRRKILNGEIEVTRQCALRLVGPDCAYHLYGVGERKVKRKGNRIREKDQA